jgi:hypothetical protein
VHFEREANVQGSVLVYLYVTCYISRNKTVLKTKLLLVFL